jgi:hypothetical protein
MHAMEIDLEEQEIGRVKFTYRYFIYVREQC